MVRQANQRLFSGVATLAIGISLLGMLAACSSSLPGVSNGTSTSPFHHTIQGKFQHFQIPTPDAAPIAITSDPHGNVWFTEAEVHKIGRITPSGVITEFVVGAPSCPTHACMEGIAYGPDGNIWFTDTDLNKIGRMTLDGRVTEFDVPTPDSLLAGITAGPDGNIWFTEVSGGKIGRITPNGVIREYTLPSHAIGHGTPVALVVGPDGNLWFSDHDAIGRITTNGAIKTWPTLAGLQISVYKDIAAGPGGAIWFIGDVFAGNNTWLGKIGRITPDGAIRYFSLPTENTYATTITSGPDGNLWFAEIDVTLKYEKIGKITPAGEISEYPVPTDDSDNSLYTTSGITFATDGTLWFIDGIANQVWHLS